MVGLRSFEDPDWEPLEDQPMLALEYAEAVGSGFLWLEGGMRYAFDQDDVPDGFDTRPVDVETFELSIGVLKSIPLGSLPLRPYIGGGGGLLFADIDEEDDDFVGADDATVGGYLKAGLVLQLSPRTHIGFEVRYFDGGELSLDGLELDSQSTQAALVLGTSF